MSWRTDDVRITDGVVYVERCIETAPNGIGTYKVIAAISVEDIKKLAKAIAEGKKNELV